ncbi:glycosyltransferase [Labrys sp. 22185]|uniref:glycosyltransferase n=1 Tax=Labrys sp. 22185 TaxID=3453888 RepID=UPI003F83FCB0
MHEKICAVVVSYNRAYLLKFSLEAIQHQTIHCDILVVDNASTDNSLAVIEEAKMINPKVRSLILPRNIGGAGGFHAGIKEAYNLGYDLFWLLDDDAIASSTALEKLLLARERLTSEPGSIAPGFYGSNVRWRDGNSARMNTPAIDHAWLDDMKNGWPYIPSNYNSFVSLLITRHSVAEHGLPLRQYFIWFDDCEYTFRLSRARRGYFVMDSFVEHRTADNYSAEINQLNEKSLWKFEYGIRNQASFMRHHYGKRGYKKFVRGIWKSMKLAKTPWKLRYRIMRAAWRARRFKPSVEFP